MDEKITMKTIVSLIVGAGVERVIDDAIDATAPAEAKLPIKILRKIGAMAIGWFAAEWAYGKTEEMYAQLESTVKVVKEKVDEAVEEAENDVFEEVVG